MTFDEILYSRRSIRRYKDTSIPTDVINAVLEAGRLAPSSRNSQDWHFTVVTNPTLRKELVAMCHDQDMVAQAPLTLVVSHKELPLMSCGQNRGTVNGSIALSFMMMKAVDLGLGTCWLGAFDEAAVKGLLDIPDEYTVIAVTPLGYPDESPPARPRKSMEEIVNFKE